MVVKYTPYKMLACSYNNIKALPGRCREVGRKIIQKSVTISFLMKNRHHKKKSQDKTPSHNLTNHQPPFFICKNNFATKDPPFHPRSNGQGQWTTGQKHPVPQGNKCWSLEVNTSRQ